MPCRVLRREEETVKQLLFAILALGLAGSLGCGEKRDNPIATGPPAPGGTLAVSAFADTSLETAVRAALGKPQGLLTGADLLSLKELDASGRGIADLEGIEQLDSLTSLVLADNQVADLSPLAGLKQLRFLDLDNNKVSDISSLAGLGQLESAILSRNEIRDFSPLLGLEHLKSVELGGNPIGEAALREFASALAARGVEVIGAGIGGGVVETPVPVAEPPVEVPKLFADEEVEEQVRLAVGKEGQDELTEEDLLQVKELYLTALLADSTGTAVIREVNLEGIQRLKNLTRLLVHYHRVSDISYLVGLDKLVTLELRAAGMGDVSALAGLQHLTRLELSINQIEDITSLAGLTGLISLDLSNNRLKDISPLASLTGLSVLNLSNLPSAYASEGLSENQVSDLAPLANLQRLTRLNLAGNQVSDLGPLMELKNLVDLNLTGNPLDAVSRDTYVPALRARGVRVEW
jgi:Leucine-rich repeat (LRR) protein